MSRALRVLLADPDATARELTRQQLEISGGGFEILEAEDARATLCVLRAGRVDCVLIADRMAGPGGERVHTRIARSGRLPVVVIGEAWDPGDSLPALTLGAQDVLQRDELSPAGLCRALRYAVERHRLVRQLHEARHRLQAQATTDPLTGLPNRRGLEARLIAELDRCRRHKRALPAAVLVDCDDFKSINSGYGHAGGDAALVALANAMRVAARTSDVVARVGGDEFIMLLPETNARDALIVADRVRTAVGALRVDFDGRRFGVTVSLGIAPVDPSWTTASEVLAAAQAGLEHSKAEGKNQVRLSGAFSLSALELDPFQLALMRGTAVRAAHQPIFDLQAGQITGYEMLSRPQIEGLGSPMKLFRMAESRGLTDAADIACLRACARAAAELEGIIHLNLLPTTLRDVPADRLLALLPPQLVRRTCLELCEHHLVESATELTEAVAALRAAGVRVALDDVGFGRTSLETLLSLKPEIIKIDRRLVTGAGEDAGKRMELQRLISVAQALGAEVVAEGVESERDRQVLLLSGVRHAQGYFLGRPQLPSEATTPRRASAR